MQPQSCIPNKKVTLMYGNIPEDNNASIKKTCKLILFSNQFKGSQSLEWLGIREFLDKDRELTECVIKGYQRLHAV